MKKLFGKKVVILFLVMNVLLSFLVAHAETNVEFVDCNILQKGISDGDFQEIVQIKTADKDGIVKTYSFAERVRINGSNYRNVQDIYDAIEENSFAKMVVEDEVITVLNFGSTYETYENAEYNSEAGVFITEDAELQTLPVYYRYNGEFVTPYLDESHYYDIEVYDYAICINQMKSKTEKTVIDYIDIGSKIGGDFTQTINIYCEFETQDSSVLKGELYDEGSRLICEGEGEHGELSFGGLENESKAYVVKFWLEDREGNEKSSKYIKEYTVNKGEVKDTFISRKGLSSTGFEEVVMIKAADKDGIEKTYYFAEKVRINGSNYRNAQDIYDAVEENSFAKMAVEDGAITVLNFGSSLGNYQNAEYNSKDKAFIAGDAEIQSLPVYYRYNEDFVKPYLDENHYYDIDVYDYAICINEMKSKTEKTVIDYIDIGSKIGSDFNQVITVCCEVNGDQSFTLKGRIYDEKRKLVSSAECEFSGYGELTFEKIRNKSENCTIELWLEDDTNKKVSESYIIYKQLMQSKIKYGKVDMKYTNEDEKLILSVRDIDGTENFYVCDENTSVVNMVTLFSSRSTTVDIPEDSFVKMAVDDGVVSVIEIEPENLEIHAQDISYGDRLSGDMYMLNNTQDVETFMSCVAIYSSTDTLKYCDIITMELSSGDCLSVMPELSGYNYEQGDYLRMFAWEDGNIMPLTEAVSADIICR